MAATKRATYVQNSCFSSRSGQNRPRRVADVVERMRRSGTINDEMEQAARRFQYSFHRAALGGPGARDLSATIRPRGRRHGATPARTDMADAIYDAREKVAGAVYSLGGWDSRLSSVVWHVVGCGESLRAWSTRTDWSGKAMDYRLAAGLLAASLELLAREPDVS